MYAKPHEMNSYLLSVDIFSNVVTVITKASFLASTKPHEKFTITDFYVSVNVFYVQIAIGNCDWFCQTFLQQLSSLNVDYVIIKALFVSSTKPHYLNSKSR